MTVRFAKVALEYQPLIHEPPVQPANMRGRATSNDKTTVDHWRAKWLENIAANKARFGEFSEHSIGKIYGKHEYKPCIVAGSGPSLKHNGHLLRDRGDIPLVSCLHNFHFFEDLEVRPDYYCSLDCQNLTIEEVTEGGKKDVDWYWERTKDNTLLAYVGSDPELLEKWQGEVLLFNAPLPDQTLNKEVDSIERFYSGVSSGGNVLGTCVYVAKAILGCYKTIFVGADFSFGYPDIEDEKVTHRFHSWKSKYDEKMGRTVRVTDVFGNKVHTWPSYYNFKSFFDWLALTVPGDYWNCTEGGCLGAYPQGNLAAFHYSSLADALKKLSMHKEIEECMINPKCDLPKILY